MSFIDKAAYVKALYNKGLNFPAWSPERTEFHLESFWNFSNWFRPQSLPYQPFHKEWMRIAVGDQYFCVLAPRDHCIVGDTLVSLANNQLKKAQDIQVGDEVKSFNRFTFDSRPVTKIFNNGVKEVWRVTTMGGKEIVATLNHKLCVGRNQYTPISQLKLGSQIITMELDKYAAYDRIVKHEYMGAIQTYDFEVEEFHNYVANGIVSHNSKSSSFGANYPLWRLFMDSSSTIMLVASAAGVAELSLRVIRETLETNELLKQTFGNLFPSSPSKWTNSELVVNRPSGIAHPSVVALGVGAAILSRRAKYVIADDIVKDDEVQNEEQRNRLKSWVNGVLLGVLEAEDQAGFIGTRKADHDFYSEIEVNPVYHFYPYDVIQKENENGSWDVLWPTKWSEARLREKMDIIGTYEFNRNYRNITMGATDSPFPSTWLEQCKDTTLSITRSYPYDDLKIAIGCDLSMSQQGKGSYFVAMVVGLQDDGRYVVLNMIRDHFNFPKQVEVVGRLIEAYNPDCVVVESNAYQGALTDTLKLIHPTVNIEAHMTGRNKYDPQEGIPLLQPIIEKGRIRFPYGDTSAKLMTDTILEELNRLGVARWSDTVLALWFSMKWLAPYARSQVGRKGRAAII